MICLSVDEIVTLFTISKTCRCDCSMLRFERLYINTLVGTEQSASAER